MNLRDYMLGVWTGAIIMMLVSWWAISKIKPTPPTVIYETKIDNMMRQLGAREQKAGIR